MEIFTTSPCYDYEVVFTENPDNNHRVRLWAAHKEEASDIWPLPIRLMDFTEDGEECQEASMPWMASNFLVLSRQLADRLGEDLDEAGDLRLAFIGSREFLVMRARHILGRECWEGEGVVMYPSGGVLTLKHVRFLREDAIPDHPFVLEGYEMGSIFLPKTMVDNFIHAGARGTSFVRN